MGHRTCFKIAPTMHLHLSVHMRQFKNCWTYFSWNFVLGSFSKRCRRISIFFVFRLI